MYELYLKGKKVGWHKGQIGMHAFCTGMCSWSLAHEEGTVITLAYDREVYRSGLRNGQTGCEQAEG